MANKQTSSNNRLTNEYIKILEWLNKEVKKTFYVEKAGKYSLLGAAEALLFNLDEENGLAAGTLRNILKGDNVLTVDSFEIIIRGLNSKRAESELEKITIEGISKQLGIQNIESYLSKRNEKKFQNGVSQKLSDWIRVKENLESLFSKDYQGEKTLKNLAEELDYSEKYLSALGTEYKFKFSAISALAIAAADERKVAYKDVDYVKDFLVKVGVFSEDDVKNLSEKDFREHVDNIFSKPEKLKQNASPKQENKNAGTSKKQEPEENNSEDIPKANISAMKEVKSLKKPKDLFREIMRLEKIFLHDEANIIHSTDKSILHLDIIKNKDYRVFIELVQGFYPERDLQGNLNTHQLNLYLVNNAEINLITSKSFNDNVGKNYESILKFRFEDMASYAADLLADIYNKPDLKLSEMHEILSKNIERKNQHGISV